MWSAFRPNGFDLFAIVALIGTTVLFTEAAFNAASLYTSVQPMTMGQKVAGCLGWLIATFGPITTSTVFWRLSKCLRPAWIFHILMLPLAIVMLKLGSSIMLFAIDGPPDFDDTIGGPVLQAIALLILTMIGYYTAVSYVFLKQIFGCSKVS